ncbi:MAG: type sorting protein [Mucilaginibacter sp.]|nr:type sorting protein [Mucilaginibacter sp.]
MKNGLLVFLFLILSFRGYSQCTLSVNLSSTSSAICSGNSTVLTATPSGGTAPYTYVWSTGEITSSITVNKAGSYTVTVSDKTTGCQPVKQNITITSANVPLAPTAAPQVVCFNSPATLTATAPGGTYQWYDAAIGGNFLATGATYTTPPISAATTFYVETTNSGCTSPRTAVNVTLPGTPGTAGATVCAGNTATLLASGGGTYAWYNVPSGGSVLGTGSTFITPVLLNTATYYVVVTSSLGCVSAPVRVVAIVSPPPQAPTLAPVAAVCSGSGATLHASAPAGIFDWFDVPNGGTSLISSPDYTTPALSTTTTYYVQTSLNGCVSPRTPVTVTVNPIPTAPVVQPGTTCSGTSATLTATAPGGIYQWYDALSGGTLLATGVTFTTPVLTNSTTYYVQTVNGGCVSPRAAVNVTISPPPAAPTASGSIVCPGSSATLTATGSTGTYQWYDAATGGNLLANTAGYTTPALLANTTYYVQTTVLGCVSARTAVTVTVFPPATQPTVLNTSTCSGSTATLTASGASGNYEWYDAAVGGNLLSANQVYVTPALIANTTYYVQSTSANGCASARTPVTVTVNAIPATPTVSAIPVCPGLPETLTASVPTGTVQWYDAASGGNLLSTGNSFTTPALGANITYFVQNTIGTCVSPRIAVVASIISVANPQFQYSSGTFCTSGSNPAPIINNPSGGTFSASPAGLNFVSTTTGQINVATSVPGNYIVAFSSNGACPGTTTAAIGIVTLPDAHFSYSGSYCTDGINPLPTFPAGSSAGVFSASPVGLTFVNKSTGEINLSASRAGTYTVTNTIAASGSCVASVINSTVTIDKQVTVNAGPNQTVPTGTPVQLAGTILDAPGGKWSGGTGTFSNPNLLNAVYTPGPGESSAALTLLSNDPPGPCGPRSDRVNITFSFQPAAPTVPGKSVCMGASTTLSAIAPGGTYQWYDAAAGGTLLTTGPTYTTLPLNVNTTYYVQTTIAGVTSTRTAVTVTVNAIPAVPVVPAPAPICAGNTIALTASGSVGTYQWYDAAIGGNLLFTGNTYTTSVLTVNTSYYVQATLNSCTSTRNRVDVLVNPIPAVNSSGTDNICSGNALNYTITADIATATFTWSRAAIAGISNPAIINQASATITEALINTSPNPVNVTYKITPSTGSCAGAPFNYVVTVYPSPAVTSNPAATICSGTSSDYAVTFNDPGISFSWSRVVVPGISNATVTAQNSSVIREVLFNTTNLPIDVTYVFIYKIGGCSGTPFNFVVTVNPTAGITSSATGTACSGTPQGYVITSSIPSTLYNWSRAAVPNISNPAVSNQTSGIINEALINTSAIPVKVTYLITPMANTCPGTQFKYITTVNPQTPTPVANANSPVCEGTTIQLRTLTIPNATYLWTGPGGYTSNLQNPDILNATIANSGTYNLSVTLNGCPSPVSSVPVIVDPQPIANAGTDLLECTNVAAIQLNGSVSIGSAIWSTSGSGNFLPSTVALNAQYIPSAQDKLHGSVVLTLSSAGKDDCSISAPHITITFQSPAITSAPSDAVCTGLPQKYVITSSTPTATFSWSRAAVAGISNPAVSGQTSGTINEALINSGATAIDVIYMITAIDNSCPGKPFTYTVTVNPLPAIPAVSANTPVCVGTTLHLQTSTVANATYLWTGPNGYTSNLQSPDILNVTASDAGVYNLSVTVNTCISPVSPIAVVVNLQPVPVAGSDQAVCLNATTVPLAGSVSVTNTGIWSTSGTGTFSPSNTTLNAQYIPSTQDKTSGSVKLTLSSTGNSCSVLTSTLTVQFKLLPAVTAGNDQSVCSQDAALLDGKIIIPGGGVWSTSGTGTFVPSANQLNASYVPSAADIKNGSITLTLTANAAGDCYIPTDKLVVRFIPPPTVNAGGTRYVLKGKTITLEPVVSDENVTYLWTPDVEIANNTSKNPVVTGNVDITYTLTVTDSRGCVASDQTFIKVSPEIVIPNTFTPNGDGINDQWNIKGLIAYQQAVVDIFDRYGQKVFHSIGYGVPWNGTINGQIVPFGVYYYIIDTKMNGIILSGHITIVR